VNLHLQSEVVSDLGLAEFSESSGQSFSTLGLHLLGRRYANDPDLDRPFSHLSLESFLEGQQGGVNSVLERNVIAVPVSRIEANGIASVHSQQD